MRSPEPSPRSCTRETPPQGAPKPPLCGGPRGQVHPHRGAGPYGQRPTGRDAQMWPHGLPSPRQSWCVQISLNLKSHPGNEGRGVGPPKPEGIL